MREETSRRNEETKERRRRDSEEQRRGGAEGAGSWTQVLVSRHRAQCAVVQSDCPEDLRIDIERLFKTAT